MGEWVTAVPLAVTMGDASGVGPEILLRAFAAGEVPAGALAIGDLGVLEHCRRALGLAVPLRCAGSPRDLEPDVLNVLDLGLLRVEELRVGEVCAPSGRAALGYVERATHLALRGELSAIVTLPMNKEATRLSHPDFSGHTGFIAGLCGTSRYTMMLASAQLLATHVSTHVSLKDAVERVESGRIYDVIRLTDGAAERLGRCRRIAILGLNPHAGEGGAFGREEEEQIRPAVERARAEGIEAEGPLPPDTVFGKAIRGDYGAVVCMYHDQGHIPMKLIGFEETVNVTLGLPIVRTSVDHGTAFDIAWHGTASTLSFANACRMAEQLAPTV